MNPDLIEVKPHVFLSRNDPDFHEKYLRFYPSDRTSLYAYGMSCLEKGNTEKGWSLIQQAANLHHPLAVKKLKEWEDWLKQTPPEPIETAKPKGLSQKFLGGLLLFLLLALFLFLSWALWSFVLKDRLLHTASSHQVTYERTLHHEHKSIANVTPALTQTEAEALPLLLLQSAVEYHQERKGSFPADEKTLVEDYPNNALSFIPKDTFYEKVNQGYTLTDEKTTSPLYEDALLSLHFYPKTNELALQRGKEVLVLYPVASGNTLPPSPNAVTLRVSEPKGKNGAFGAKGLALSDNYAIHGTNEPLSIGKKGVTQGCLRLLNEDIENLYPFVALGTPFIVEENEETPNSPTFPDKMPTLSEKDNKPIETSVASYNWKQ